MKKDGNVKVGRAIASFVFPIVGVVTWAANKSHRPKDAKTYLMVSAAGAALWAVGGITYGIRKAAEK